MDWKKIILGIGLIVACGIVISLSFLFDFDYVLDPNPWRALP